VQASSLRKTVTKFASLYREIAANGAGVETKLQFIIVTNRPLAPAVQAALHQLADPTAPAPTMSSGRTLRNYLAFGTDRAAEAAFCSRLQIKASEPGLQESSDLLFEELAGYIPGGPEYAVTKLRDRIAEMAATIAPNRNVLDRAAVMLCMGTSEDDLFPAPSVIEIPDNRVETEQLTHLMTHLLAPNTKLAFTALGGQGKTILTTQVAAKLPPDSVTVVFDCFAGGNYRSSETSRHKHRQALTQIANELASRSLCLPLISSAAADELFVKAFMARIRAAAQRIDERNPDALLVVIIDAADNAATFAKERGERTFAQDLWHSEWPPNARLVQFCRPERLPDLGAPPDVVPVRLTGFNQDETLAHLRTVYADATPAHAAEMHDLSQEGNPRVQAMAMQDADTPHEALTSLRAAATQPGDTLDALLEYNINKVAYDQGISASELGRLSEALGGLHPRMPIAALAAVAELNPDLIRSFAADMGHTIQLRGDTIQFRDEPTETWFRVHKRPKTPAELNSFIDRVTQHVTEQPYLSASLPQLLFEAERVDDLAELAMSDEGLPEQPPSLIQQIATDRARYALAATLRAGRNSDACRLALRAGELTVGQTRRLELFTNHTDLAGRFLTAEAIETLTTDRELESTWPGSRLLVSAAIRAQRQELQASARNPLRSATEAIEVLARRENTDRTQRHNLKIADLGEATHAMLSLGDTERAIAYIQHWRAWVGEHLGYYAGLRLADAGNFELLEGLIAHPELGARAKIGVAAVLYEHGHIPAADPAKALLATVRAADTAEDEAENPTYADNEDDDEESSENTLDEPLRTLAGRCWTAIAALRHGLLDAPEAVAVISRTLDPTLKVSVLESEPRQNFPLLLSHAICAELDGRTLTALDVAPAKVVEDAKLEDRKQSEETKKYLNVMGSLIRVATVLAKQLLNRASDDEITTFVDNVVDRKSPHNDTVTRLATLVALRAVAFTDTHATAAADISRWFLANHRVFPSLQGTAVSFGTKQTYLHQFALDLAAAIDTDLSARSETEDTIERYVELSRALLALNETEAKHYFDQAAVAAETLAVDIYVSGTAFTDIAQALAGSEQRERAYRLAQITESLESHLDLNRESLTRTLYDLNRPLALAMASRWRDRRLSTLDDLLSGPLQAAESGDGPIELLAFRAFAAFDQARVKANLAEPDKSRIEEVLNNFTAYARYEQGKRPAPEMSPSLKRRRWTLLEEDIDEVDDPTVEETAAKFDLTTPEGWDLALENVERPWTNQADLMAQALDATPAATADIIRAFIAATTPRLHVFGHVAKVLNERTLTGAAKAASKELVEEALTRFGGSISTQSYIDPDEHALVKLLDTTSVEYTRQAFIHAAQASSTFTHDKYFRLAARIATTLTSDEAEPAFDYGATLFDQISPPATAADGPYATIPTEPSNPTTSCAGLLWAALADAAVDVRWEAAHAIVLLVRLGADEALQELARFADGTHDRTPFVDNRLPFYELHAKMWLHLALARAAHEPNAGLLQPFVPLLTSTLTGTPHAANQVLAQRTLQVLRAGSVIESADVEAALAANLMPDVAFDKTHGERLRLAQDLKAAEPEYDGTRFFMDFDDYWCDDLADAFTLTEATIMRRVDQIIDRQLPHAYPAWDNDHTDPRRDLNLYRHSTTVPYKSDWPKEDGLGFYLCIHALLVVGAELAQTTATYQHDELDENEYERWLATFLPTREDGRWLYDRRDAPPSPVPSSEIPDYERDRDWRWRITKETLHDPIGIGNDWLQLWSYVNAKHDAYHETVSIESAMVSKRTSQSLLRAMANTPATSLIFNIPSVGDEDRYSRETPPPAFTLRAWVDETHPYKGIDKLDRRSGDVDYPPARPRSEVVEKHGLTPDADMRTWIDQDGEAVRTQVWTTDTGQERDPQDSASGRQLHARLSFILTMLQEHDMDLLIRTAVHRTYYPSRYQEKDHDDELEYTDWSAKSFLLHPDGTWSGL